jgi:hypothetical protein
MSGHGAIRHVYNSPPIATTAHARPSRCFSPLGQEYDLGGNSLSPVPLRMPPLGNPAPGIGKERHRCCSRPSPWSAKWCYCVVRCCHADRIESGQSLGKSRQVLD